MKTVFKWLARGAGALLLLAGLTVIVGYAALRSSLPADDGALAVAGLVRESRIQRDRNGIPHIEAGTHEDAARALGVAHAQDRFWQMHVMRMVAQGRLSELFGSATVDTDIFLRTVDIEEASRRSYEAMSDEARQFLNAYAEGVNAWLERDAGLLRVKLPPEFVILGKDAEPWEPWQSVAILKVMALTLDSNLSDEIRRLALSRLGLSPNEIDDLMPYGPRDDPPPLPDLRTLYGHGDTARAEPDAVVAPYFELAWDIGMTASNNWVVSGSRTETGSPLLANDPHLGLQTPTVFYLAHLAFRHDGEQRHLVGGSLPGTPLILVGRNDLIAWGVTTTNLDSQDLYVERLKPDDSDSYLTPEGWRPFEKSEITIEVSGAPAVSFARRRTRHGPVLPEGYRGLGNILPPGHIGALQWVSLAHDDVTAEGAMMLNRAGDVFEFLAATRKLVAPMQSVVVADSQGNIGIIAPGRAPVRDPANLVRGRAPVPGWLAEYDWKGWLANSELPRLVNPPSGALATANANWLPPGYSHFITYDWDENFRQARVEARIVDTDELHSPRTMKAVQADDYSPALDQFRREALARLEPGAGQDDEILSALREWDGRMTMDSPLPLIMTAWWRHTAIHLFEDDLGADYGRFAKGYLQPVIDALTLAGAREWCDDRKTERHETCGMILAQSMPAALDELRSLQGEDWRKWRWGQAHRALGEHRPFSSVGPLARFFAVTPESAGGSYTLLRGYTDFSGDEPYRNTHASAYRAWYDLADPDQSQYIISTGQSGHFLSDHYDDMADEWARMRYVTIPTKRENYIEDVRGSWILKPRHSKERS